MKEIMTQEELDLYKQNQYYSLMEILGGEIYLTPKIMFRETPHSNSIFIDYLSINDDFESFGLAKDTVLQRLRQEIHINKTHLRD